MSEPSSQSDFDSDSSLYESGPAGACTSRAGTNSDLKETLYFGEGCDDPNANLLANYAITPFDDEDIYRERASEPRTFGSFNEYLRLRKVWLAADYQPRVGKGTKMTTASYGNPSIPIADSMRNCVLQTPTSKLYGEPLNKAQYDVYAKYFKASTGSETFDVRWENGSRIETWDRAIQLKFRSSRPEAQRARDFLLNTGNKVLTYKHKEDEDSNYWRDQLGLGEDLLADLLMQMRQQLRTEGVQVGGEAKSLKESGFTLDVSAI